MKKFGLFLIAAALLSIGLTTTSQANAAVCTPSMNTYAGEYSAKYNGISQGNDFLVTATIEVLADCRVNLIAASDVAGQVGSFYIDTTNIEAWKNYKTAVTTWKSTLFNASQDNSSVYIGGDYREMNGNTTAIFKTYSSGTKAYFKIAGSAFNGTNTTNFELEVRFTGLALQ